MRGYVLTISQRQSPHDIQREVFVPVQVIGSDRVRLQVVVCFIYLCSQPLWFSNHHVQGGIALTIPPCNKKTY